MQIAQIRTIPGPNVYSHSPVLVMKLGLGELYRRESNEFPEFIDKLLALLPGLHEHHCGLGRRGGFVERLHTGTYFGHVVEHVALELTDAVGISVNRGKTVSAGEPGWYLVAVAYKSEAGMKCLLTTAVELVDALLAGQPYPLEAKLAEARQAVPKHELGPSTRALVEAAERRGIPWSRVSTGSLIRLGYGRNRKFVEATVTSNTNLIAADIAADKDLTKLMLSQAGLPVPRGHVVSTLEEALEAWREIDGPVVVKPLNGNQGKGVSLNLYSAEQIAQAFQAAQAHSRHVIVEEHYLGRDYRILVIHGKVVAASERTPPRVTGDGERTIRGLIGELNLDPRRGEGHGKPLTAVQIDPIMEAYLAKSGLTPDSVPAPGQTVYLRESANLSTGGSARDVTPFIHPDNAFLCERAARTIGLDVCGVDLVMPDITQPHDGVGGIVELNAGPGIRMHHHPCDGQSRDVAGLIMDSLYPPGTPSRIPIISITGTNGKTTTTRLISHILASTGQTVGMTTTDGISIGGRCVSRGDFTGPWSAGVVLADLTVDVAVLETARGGIVRSGLGYDWSDIGVITNIQADHIGQDGIESLEDIARIKSLVSERTREGGTLVLNADDPHVVAIPEGRRARMLSRNIVYFSLSHRNPVVQRHLASGGKAFVVKGGWIEERTGLAERRLLRIASVPITLGGAAQFQTVNLLAAIAACRAQGVAADQIASALQTFRTDRDNAGRLNLFEVGQGYVLIDYGHNPAAFAAICRMTAAWRERRLIGIVGVPGDRTDDLIREAARIAAQGFDHLVLREDVDLRGRAPGETLALLQQAIAEENSQVTLDVIPDEHTALRTVLSRLKSNEIVVAFCEHPEAAVPILREFGAQPASAIRPLAPITSRGASRRLALP